MDERLPERAHLVTEQVNPDSARLDRLDSPSLVELFCREDERVVPAVRAAAPAIARAIDLTAAALRGGGRLFYVGAGTSGRLGVLDASECPPTFCTDPEQVQGIIAGGTAALTRSVEGAEDDPEAGAAELAGRALSAADVVVGISAGGTAPYVSGALAYARSLGGVTIFVACVPTNQIPERWDIEIRVPVGPEVLAGSTRLKAGTATKLVLNILSTGAMVRLGKTYGNLMVDVAVSNQKLRDRAVRILTTLTELERTAALALLEASGLRVKVALLMHWSNQDPASCATALEAAGGLLPVALEKLSGR
ncbi:N-acetylmuramic acid 6-phosphate etherase [Gloeobacter violaceus]|uniref:N-acetylmuramic acid 6-phosphate etherase n=1 Tax=Gloeobacter violaceus (strain ATCC 29082 / PCC 7421) TaxID=251221 RepID=MURQ_GLOVI|nr:N-acetylmuramic acid 6-phosphate etherase [Gloeobacter violaceus]Q7NE68.1 RecName: Full=N-acetylmuramic acid 6-phosphate etherase; Short=MurNAc-6-P etherase; AltName: Full=N-acetylmuramic acid 6-phosphate hydrolase; AltName: Full=N-acetylmuramic acid 6-phosphate lyase [Gloeobacter violaceus PCC 7421]BAC91953.1 glr4012 [Gloeobacter violaceus PCC 7421]